MLRIYPVVLEVLRLVKPLIDQIRKSDPDLADQLKRAATSVALNTSEGAYSYGKNIRARFDNALGSAAESRSCLQIAELWGYIEPIDPKLADQLDRVIATLHRLAKR
jgi:four helix bundle protein